MTLPQGWAEATIGDVIEPIETDDPARRPQQAFRYVDIGSIDNARFQITDPKEIIGLDAPSRARRKIKARDVLFSTVRPYLKNIAQVPDHLDGEFTSTGICVLRATDAVEPGYLFRRVISQDFIDEMTHASDGTMYPAIADKDVFGATVALPPLAEQRRIVAKLDALTARLARARAELDRVPVLAAQLRARTLAEAFDGKFIRGLVSHRPCDEWIVSTFYGPRFGKDEYVDQGIPTARTTDFNSDGTMCLEGAPQVACSDADFAKWGLEEGDLLVTRTGSIGKCAIYTPDLGRVLPSAYLIRVRFTSTILTRFAWMMFASPQGQQHLGVNSRAVTQPNINASAIRSLPFPAMDVAAQQATIDAVDRAFTRADRLETEATRARALLDRLESALLAKAFRGELVPQDPNDEPAQTLLDRIRTQRAAAPKAKRGRKAKAPA